MGGLRVLYMPMVRVQELAPSEHWALISISDPGQVVEFKYAWKNLLKVEFKDVYYPRDDFEAAHFKRHECMRTEHALQIRKFVEGCVKKNVIDTIICQSTNYRRSAAVARFIAEHTGARIAQDTTHCNSFVYSVLSAPEKYQRLLNVNGSPENEAAGSDQRRVGQL